MKNDMKMKKLLFILSIAFVLMGCTESKVKSTATDYLQKQMKDPSSFKAENIQVILDTIPIFLNRELLSAAEEANEALENYNRYKDRDSYLWYDEKQKASSQMSSALLSLGIAYNLAKAKKDKSYEYMVLINCSGKNSYGSTVSSKYIVIVDKDKTDKVIGEYHVNTDFLEKILAIYYTQEDEKAKLKENEFGKIDTDNMTPIEQFIFNEQ